MSQRYPQAPGDKAIVKKAYSQSRPGQVAMVLSGGGARAAYQVGALRALIPFLERETTPVSIIVGSSIGAINGLILAATIKNGYASSVEILEQMWRERSYPNTFLGSPSQAFFRAIKLAVLQYMSPGPKPTSDAIFDPTPLRNSVDAVIREHGGLLPENRDPQLSSVGVMTTIEGSERKPLLFLSTKTQIDEEIMKGASFAIAKVDDLSAKHGFASAALPSVLPPVELDTEHGTFRLVDGGISQNVPVDPAVRLGAERVIVLDISGRSWWLDHYGESHDTRPTWEVPASFDTFCLRPPDTFNMRNQKPFGPMLKQAVSRSTKRFMQALGPVWPVFKLLQAKFGDEIAYEAVSYVALDPEYIQALIEAGYNETFQRLRLRDHIEFQRNEDYKSVATAL